DGPRIRHRVIVPGTSAVASGRRWTALAQSGRCLGVEGDLFVELFEAGDQLLDAGGVGEGLGGGREAAAEQAVERRVEEQHRVRPQRPVWPAGLEEVDGRSGQAAELDLPGDLLDELIALLLGRLVGQAHAIPRPTSSPDVAAIADSKAW